MQTLLKYVNGCQLFRPDDIAPTAFYLASDDSSWVTGETHYIAGGLH